jgi:hypothetical protein
MTSDFQYTSQLLSLSLCSTRDSKEMKIRWRMWLSQIIQRTQKYQKNNTQEVSKLFLMCFVAGFDHDLRLKPMNGLAQTLDGSMIDYFDYLFVVSFVRSTLPIIRASAITIRFAGVYDGVFLLTFLSPTFYIFLFFHHYRIDFFACQ